MSATRYDWFNIFNLDAWISSGLVAQTLVLNLEGRGKTTFEVTQGNTTAVRIEAAGIFLPVGFLENNPYVQSAYAVYVDAANEVWFGYEVTT